MSEVLSYERLRSAVSGSGVALRCRAELQPAGGPGTKVFPPTYAGAVYATEQRRLPGRESPVPCVLLDSVQSQANRMEEALQFAWERGRLGAAGLPLVEVDFEPYAPGSKQPEDLRLLDPVGRISSLMAPHRIADAILRDSLGADGKPFRQTPEGLRISSASAADATALFELCPTALLFGLWDSTGPKGGLGAKFERAIVAEVVGIDAVYGVKTSSRIDPLGIAKSSATIYEAADSNSLRWTTDPEQAKRKNNKPVIIGKDGKPSEVNHGNVTPSLSDRDKTSGEYLAGGVTIAHAEHSVVISLAALRRLRFPVDGKYDARDAKQHQRDDAARAVLAAMGLLASALTVEQGMDLRSRCVLWPPEAGGEWELLAGPGKKETVGVEVDAALKLYGDAVSAAKDAGLPWRSEPLTLTPSEQLVKLVVKSQELAAKSGGGDEGEGSEG